MTERLDPYELFADDEWDIDARTAALDIADLAGGARNDLPERSRDDDRKAA